MSGGMHFRHATESRRKEMDVRRTHRFAPTGFDAQVQHKACFLTCDYAARVLLQS